MNGSAEALTAIRYRLPCLADGGEIWKLVRDSRKLDLNTPYFYLTMSHWFSQSCRVAEETESGSIIGLVTGFRQPSQPDTLFVWQIAVDERYRGRGIARGLLDHVADYPDILFIEATISPSNDSSKGLFKRWATSKNALISVSAGFMEDDFPYQKHEREDLYRIGPLK
ncbi:diaminobutyrate acetyltransferase [Cohnella lupini]|uniref:L-2,4-diaminobutyric acid acetyltransferase n=1 Tax=Cohnella lupini TaxID=1294267 RepID=A0A3D9HU75_9BACL|nr:diaminobutyrate acetyltransferase [Cohnella lupini]RED52980.1 L-2,4-diaminobutyric acid acetyltransferase [Cohnella lupini]